MKKMDFRGLLVVGMLLLELCCVANANFVLPVQRKFQGPVTSLSAIKAHDARRHGRFLSAVDFNLGGDGLPSETGFVFTIFVLKKYVFLLRKNDRQPEFLPKFYC